MTHVNVPIALVVIGAFVVVLAIVVLLRQAATAPARGGQLDCFLWKERPHGASWRGGTLRFAADGLHWHREDSLRRGTDVVLRRTEILDLERHADEAEGDDPQRPTELEFVRRDRPPVRLLVPFTTSSAVVAWYEAAPTGAVRGDAD